MSYTEDDDNFENLDRGNDFEEEVEDENEEDSENTDEEGEEEEETEALDEEEEIEEEVPPKKESPRIPKERLDKALRQRDELRERSLWLEEQLEKLIEMNSKQNPVQSPKAEATPTYDFDTAEESYANLLIEGDIAKATKLRREIDNERQKEFRALIADIKNSSVEAATTQANVAADNKEFNLLIQNYENKYPFLDSESDDHNEDAVETVNTLLSGYLAKGLTKSQALKKAVEKVAPMFSKEKVESKTKSISKERTVEAGKKAAQAAKAQPSKTKSSSASTIDTSKLNISKMTERDFNKLTPKELKLLRGD